MLLQRELDELRKFISGEENTMGRISMEAGAKLRFSFPGHTSQLERIRLIAGKVAAYVPSFTEENINDIGLAVDEACANVIIHSYADASRGNIRVEFTLGRDRIWIRILDNGKNGQTFQPDELAPVEKEAYLRSPTRGGLGVHLIKKIMDKVEYTVLPGIHNCLQMVKLAGCTPVNEKRYP